MINWFSKLSIRWKLQLGFFVVTMITTIFNRVHGSSELNKLINIAKTNQVNPDVIQQLEANHSLYIFNSFWESGIEFAIQFMVIGFVASIFVKPIINLCNAHKLVEEGDLTVVVPQTSQDEIGTLQRSFNDLRIKLNMIMGSIDENGKNMGQSAYQIANISREIAEISNYEHQRSGEVSTATQQLQSISEAVQHLSNEATNRARNTEQHANDGITKVQKNIGQMNQTAEQVNRAAQQISQLEKSAIQIHDIVSTISGIAEMTNLLSLNAAIEAARAGESGRGFAVVADEVRNLAKSTTKSVGEIAGIIAQVTSQISEVSATMAKTVEQVHENSKTAGETREVIKLMAEEIANTSSGNQEISRASQEQLEKLQVLNVTLTKLFETLDESSSKVETTATIGEDLFTVTERLNSLMTNFKFEHKKVIEPNQDTKRVFPRATNSLLVKVNIDGVFYEGITRDISLGGMQLRLTKELKTLKDLQIQVYLPYDDVTRYHQQEPLLLLADSIRHDQANGRHIYGIKFHTLNPLQKEQLESCFEFFRKNPTFDMLEKSA